jgi:predicted esterase
MTGARVAMLVLAACATSSAWTESDVVFTRYSPLSRNAEIARRALPPLTYQRFQQALATQGLRLSEQAIDLAKERFELYVPSGPPPARGYAVLVFVSPSRRAAQPRFWRTLFDRRGMIFVSAHGSGNDENILDRRVPLALLAYDNVRARYPIDAERVYVGGLSGGGRTAEIIALAYPDVFRGALLNAGADPIDGQDGIYKPPAELFRQFQRTRLVYATGERDDDVLAQDEVSRRSMHEACVFDVKTETMFGMGHESLDTVGMDRALDDLEAPRAVDEAALARCNAGVEREIAAALADAAAAIARGDRDGARAKVKAIDARFAGLAAAGIVELDARLVGGRKAATAGHRGWMPATTRNASSAASIAAP